MPEARIGYAPFPEQAAYFRRKINVPTARWDDLMHGDHAHGFMVAGLTRMDVLDDIRQAIEDAISKGETLDDFRKRFDAAVAGKWTGFTGDGTAAGRAWRTSIIYQTNLRTSYMAGRWERLKKFPYLRYQHNTVNHPRVDHQSWNGLIIARDDPWWDVHYPPNGWGCRCTVFGVSEAGLRAARGDAGANAAPALSPKDEPPPEWAYHVGKQARALPAAEAFGRKVMALPPAWRKMALDDAQSRQVEWFGDTWRGSVRDARQSIEAGRPTPDGSASPVAFLGHTTANVLEVAGVAPQSALLAMTDRQIVHAIRDAKGDDLALLLEAVSALPSWLGSDDVLIFRDATSVQLAREVGDHRYVVAVIRIDSLQTRAKDKVQANWITTVKVIGPSEVGKLKRLR